MKLLAIDFSTKDTGYAFRHPITNEYVVGAIKGGSNKDPLERTLNIANQMSDIIKDYSIEDYFIVIEEPIITMKTKGNISLVRANGYFLALMRERFSVGSIDIPNSKWASYHFIKGKREQRKEQSIAILKGYDIVEDEYINDDMADAFCILVYCENGGVSL